MGGAVSGITRGLTDVATFGTAEIGGVSKKFGDAVGGIVSGKGLGGGSMSAPTIGGQQSPLQTLSQTGGAPLLMDIALGADVGTSVMSYFGVNGDFDTWVRNLNPQDKQAVQSLTTQLEEIKSNTDTQTQAVQKLANDYPNIMTQKIQQYQQIADPTIQKMMGQAMTQITQNLSAKQAAGGMISSGAALEAQTKAAAEVGAQYGAEELNYATGLAQGDFDRQLSIASGLQQFQQKMLGQGAMQGFNAVQNQLQRNTNIGLAQAGYQNEANRYNTEQQNQMYGALGGLAGTVVGGMMGGPMGAYAGGQLGSTFGGSPMYGPAAPRLNFGRSSPMPTAPSPNFAGSYPSNIG